MSGAPSESESCARAAAGAHASASPNQIDALFAFDISYPPRDCDPDEESIEEQDQIKPERKILPPRPWSFHRARPPQPRSHVEAFALRVWLSGDGGTATDDTYPLSLAL